MNMLTPLSEHFFVDNVSLERKIHTKHYAFNSKKTVFDKLIKGIIKNPLTTILSSPVE